MSAIGESPANVVTMHFVSEEKGWTDAMQADARTDWG
jgi:hypothetical protein